MLQQLNRFSMPRGFRGRNALYVQVWWILQASVFRLSPQFAYGFRRWLLRCFGARVGKRVLIRPSVRITYPWKLSVGDYVWIGDDVVLYTLGSIHIGSNAVVSQRSYLCAGGHDYTSRTFDIFAKPIHVGAEAWLATDVFVAPGVEIGAGTVVGARSSVFKSLPGGIVAMGSPAQVVGLRKTRNEAES